MHPNRATIYSNGIADFQRIFRVEGNKTNSISIPVRQQHLGDVLASLTVSGLVRIVSPPSYQPANQDDSSISIATGDALITLAQQLAGAEAEVTMAGSAMTGKVIGIHTQQIATSGEPVDEQQLVMLTTSGISKIAFRQIERLQFTDPTVQTEIDKALNRRLREIKPNSTFVDLELGTEEESTDAIIQYTIPAAAWKISYRILINDEGPIELHGHAIVDNNTDEDWKDFVIAVVMGQPISFTTDLADSKTPSRSHVNIVQESALGAVEVEEEMAMMAMTDAAMPLAGGRGDQDDDMFQTHFARPASRRTAKRIRSAKIEEAEVSETGDFCIFESAGPVSIAARRSAVIPVFATTIDQSKPVLHFKTENHPERPFRALRFVNSTSHSLGRGVCTVYEGTTYAGSCIIPATKPDADALLPHALDTAVKVRPTPASINKRRIGIRISDGVVYESHHNLAKTEYLINSGRDEPVQFMVDHELRLSESDVEVHLNRDGTDPVLLDGYKLKNGSRIEFELIPNDVVAVHFVETKVSVSRISLAARDSARINTAWLFDNFVETNSPLLNDPAVSACIEISLALETKEKELQEVGQQTERLEKRQVRLRENIKTGAADQQTAKWQSDLAETEDRIVSLEEELLPKIHASIKDLRLQLFDALKGLAIEWKEN